MLVLKGFKKWITYLITGRNRLKEVNESRNEWRYQCLYEVQAHKETKTELEKWRVDCKILVEELKKQDENIRYLIKKTSNKFIGNFDENNKLKFEK